MVTEDQSDLTHLPAPTPEVARFWESRTAAGAEVRQMTHRILIMFGIFLVALISVAVVYLQSDRTTINQDHQEIHSLKLQVACQDKAFNNILTDVRLAFQQDKNANHYAKAVDKC